MKKTFAFGAAAAQGTWPVQEDGFFADPVLGLFAVADGFGGRGAGDLAAKTALLEFRAGKKEREVFLRAHEVICAKNKSRASSGRGGASLIAARAEKGELWLSHCGACTAGLVRAGRFLPLLLPQASPREEFQPLLPDQALGLGEAPVVESRQLPVHAGDILLLASAGVEWETEAFQSDLLAQLALRTPGEDLAGLASQLVEGAAFQGWNRTVILVEFA